MSDVILAAMWAAYPTGVIQKVGSGYGTAAESKKAFTQGLDAVVSRLRTAGVRVSIVAQVPRAAVDVSRALALRRRYNIALANIEPDAKAHKEEQAFVSGVFEAATHQFGVNVVDPASTLCNGERCRVMADGHSLYADDDHLSGYGARWVAPVFAELFENIQSAPRP